MIFDLHQNKHYNIVFKIFCCLILSPKAYFLDKRKYNLYIILYDDCPI